MVSSFRTKGDLPRRGHCPGLWLLCTDWDWGEGKKGGYRARGHRKFTVKGQCSNPKVTPECILFPNHWHKGLTSSVTCATCMTRLSLFLASNNSIRFTAFTAKAPSWGLRNLPSGLARGLGSGGGSLSSFPSCHTLPYSSCGQTSSKKGKGRRGKEKRAREGKRKGPLHWIRTLPLLPVTSCDPE